MVTSPTELDAALLEFAALLEAGIRIEALVLFGSHAKGVAQEDSDIDVAVISPDFEGLSLHQRQMKIAKLSVIRPRDISPVGYPSSQYHNPEPQSFLEEIVRTGKVVYP